jgi:NAD(P)H dehydrogenase (quinone)
MKHAIIVGHPDPNSFTIAMAGAYAAAVATLGHSCIVRDLYRLEFEPRLKLSEMPTRPAWAPAPDVEAERQALKDADVFAFIYPFWFNSPPAIVKGYIERVFGAGFGYAELRQGGHDPLLKDRQLIHVTASGSSTAWLNEQGAWMSMRNLFDDYLGKICGMRVRPHIHFDSIVPGLAPRWVETNLKTLETKVISYFGQPGDA